MKWHTSFISLNYVRLWVYLGIYNNNIPSLSHSVPEHYKTIWGTYVVPRKCGKGLWLPTYQNCSRYLYTPTAIEKRRDTQQKGNSNNFENGNAQVKDVSAEKEGILFFFLFYVCNYKWWVFNQHFCVLDIFQVKIKINIALIS